ncbi:choice-of-anchor J domain-containing protein [Flavobacterium lindanitolerans]|uniref:choice-of-anchor J domain-containing protein n=2 Tax=Flavobacterium lindanitolerans TaxID=428988 RepID=UPI0027B92538|nr:choice-of-anchor J domain-containing protein [Flavobacterium lindanitolerans]
MKMNKITTLLFASLTMGMMSSCVNDDDTTLPDYTPLIFGEDFSEGADNTLFEKEGWLNFAETGTVRWTNQVYSGNGYAEFTSYQSGQASNIGWLITPGIDLDAQEGEKLVFQTAQAFVDNAANTIEVLISTDFDGTNVTAATWQSLSATFPTTSATYYQFIKSGVIDLSRFTGTAHIAFRVKGNGTTLDGTYQIDNIRVYN